MVVVYEDMKKMSSLIFTVMGIIIFPLGVYASGESYNASTNPFEYDCGTSNSIEIYDITADGYLPGYSDSDYDNCGASISLLEGNEYEGNIRNNDTVTLSIGQFTAVASGGSSGDFSATVISGVSDTVESVFVENLWKFVAIFGLSVAIVVLINFFVNLTMPEYKRRLK